MDESQYKTLCELAKDGTLSQRDLSKRMGLSLGKVNYVVNELLKKGLIKASRFKNSKNKIAYMYVLTPRGFVEKTSQTYHFLTRKVDEYNRLKQEIETLRRETENDIPQGYQSQSADLFPQDMSGIPQKEDLR